MSTAHARVRAAAAGRAIARVTRSGGAAGRVTAAVALVGMLVGRFESMVTAGALPAPLSQSSVGRAILALTRTTCAVAGYDILVEGT